MTIANWLYDKEIPFDQTPKKYRYDFYLPDYRLYVEFWGMKNINYEENKLIKTQLITQITLSYYLCIKKTLQI